MPMHRCHLKESEKLSLPTLSADTECWLCYAKHGSFPGCSLAGGAGAVDRCEFNSYHNYNSKW